MGQRGRKSTAELAVATTPDAGVTQKTYRPPPPSELSKEAASEWHEIVDQMPADWFPRETHGMLAQYCRHVIAARHVAQLIDDHEAGEQLDLDHYERLLKMQERESKIIRELATKMRMSQQSTWSAQKTKGGSSQGGVKKPWET